MYYGIWWLKKELSMVHVPWIALISANRWQLDVLTFLILGFGIHCNEHYEKKITKLV